MSYADEIMLKLCQRLYNQGHISEQKLKEMQSKYGADEA